MSKLVIDRLEKRFGDAILSTHDQFGDDTAVVDPSRWREVALFLRDDARCAMDHFIDLTAVDYLHRRSPRFEVVLHLRSTERLHRVRIKAPVDPAPGEDTPHIDSVVDVWKGANWFEREAFDMFGVVFDGHPDLRRILTYPEFVGHPLRKDFVANHTQPLIPYREGVNNEKLAPFGIDEGMPFGRQTHDQWKKLVAERRTSDDGRNVLGFEEDN